MSIPWNDIVTVLAPEPVDRAIEAIVVRWAAPPSTHDRFRSWARSLRAWVLSSGVERLPPRLLFLKDQHRWLHSELAGALLQGGLVDDGLVNRRAFVGYLIDMLEPFVEAAPHLEQTVAA